MESKHLKVKSFVSTDSAISTGQAWEESLEEIEEAADKKDAMIIYGRQELARLEKSLPDPEQPEEEGNQMDE